MRGERGSVLVLLPATVLVVIVLGAIAVDLSARFLAQRQAITAAEAAANDAAAAGVDLAGLDASGPLELDPAAVHRVALRSLAAQGVQADLIGPPTVRLVDPVTVRVTLQVRIARVFAPVLPGIGGHDEITVSASAHLVSR